MTVVAAARAVVLACLLLVPVAPSLAAEGDEAVLRDPDFGVVAHDAIGLQRRVDMYQWHREGFELPRGAVRLAESDAFANQAIQVGRAAFGVQFHPELTTKMVYRWTTLGHERLELPNARPRAEHFEGRALHDGKTRIWLDRFLDLWTGLMAQRARGS